MAKTLVEILLEPQKTARLTATVLFFLAVLAVFLIWVFKGDASSKIPLLILGIVSIVLILTAVERSYLCGLAIVIIGTVVAQEDFLLKVAHMFRGNPGTVEQYLSGYGQDRVAPAQRDEQLRQQITLQIEKVLGDKLPAEKKQDISDILSQAQITAATSRLKDSGASYPLEKYAEGGSALTKFLNDFEKVDIFLKHFAYLRDNGLIKCTKFDEPRSCQITALGSSVDQQANKLPLGIRSTDEKTDPAKTN